MELYVSEFSKYVITLLMALYTYESFAVFRFKTEERRSGIYARQSILMFAIHFSCFIVICFETADITYLFFYAFQQIILYAAATLYKMIYPKSNRLLVNNMCLLLSISFVMLTRLSDLDVSDVSVGSADTLMLLMKTKAVKQFVIVTGSLIIALIIPFFVHKMKFLKNLKWIYPVMFIFLKKMIWCL